MGIEKRISFPDIGLAALPLAVAYGAIPLGNAVIRFMDSPTSVSPMLPWLLLAGLGAILAMHRPSPGAVSRKGFFYKAAAFMLLVAGLFMYSDDIVAAQTRILPYLTELAPLVLLLFGGLWVGTCGLPDRADFQRFGALLAGLCIVDSVLELAVYHVVPLVRWIGNADMLAGLLLVALCASLKPGGNAGGRDGGIPEPDQGRRSWRFLIMLAILVCLSRTGLFAAAWVVLCFGRGRLRSRFLYALLCLLCLVGSFLLPTTAADAIRYTDYWLWVEAVRLYAENVGMLFTGFPINQPLPVVFPVGMGPIWEAATGSPSSFGAFLVQVPSFWLRLTMAWGVAVPLTLMTGLFIVLMIRLSRMGAGLIAALFAQGMSTLLLFDPAMAVSVGLAFTLALSGAKTVRSIKVPEPTEESFETHPQNPPDCVEEWDLRPL